MTKRIKATIQAKGLEIALHTTGRADHISLTDIARYKSDAPDDVGHPRAGGDPGGTSFVKADALAE